MNKIYAVDNLKKDFERKPAGFWKKPLKTKGEVANMPVGSLPTQAWVGASMWAWQEAAGAHGHEQMVFTGRAWPQP